MSNFTDYKHRDKALKMSYASLPVYVFGLGHDLRDSGAKGRGRADSSPILYQHP